MLPMKAVVLTRYGTSGVLELRELSQPVPRADEVLVKVIATTVNDWDWCFMRGRPLIYRLFMGLLKPKVAILGTEVSGRVEAVGVNVTQFAPGDAVYGDISEAGFGGFAEFVCVKARALVRKPSGMSFATAACIPHAAALAMQGLFDVGQLAPGFKVLINGAGGGVGTLGVQLCKAMDVEVTGVDGAAKLDMLRSVGFDHVIDYQTQDFTKSEKVYDLIVDTKTTRAPWQFARALRPGGVYVTVGGQPLRLLQLLILGPLIKLLTGKAFRIVALKPNKDLERVHALHAAGKLTCVVDGPFALADVPTAVQHFGAAKHKGKVVITVDAAVATLETAHLDAHI